MSRFKPTPQTTFLSFVVAFCALALTVPTPVNSAPNREEDYMVSNGQGISSPSFWDGLSGENPAGLTYNNSLKLQGGLASFDSALSQFAGSGALLIGNGLLGAGLEYSKYGSSAYASGVAVINWGIGGHFSSLSTSLGVSGHHRTGATSGSYDIGALIDITRALRLGVLVPSFTTGLSELGGGVTYNFDRFVDLVVDAGFHFSSGSIVLKPGLSVHTDRVQVSGAYGFGLTGPFTSVMVNEDLTLGLGIKVLQTVLIEYEYQGSPVHRLGLTLKLN